MTDAINREYVIRMAKESGFKACVGTTDKEGNYHPFVNALGKDIPIEWLERFAALAALRAQPDPIVDANAPEYKAINQRMTTEVIARTKDSITLRGVGLV